MKIKYNQLIEGTKGFRISLVFDSLIESSACAWLFSIPYSGDSASLKRPLMHPLNHAKAMLVDAKYSKIKGLFQRFCRHRLIPVHITHRVKKEDQNEC